MNGIKIEGDGPLVMVDDSESDAFLARKCYERSSLDNGFVWLDSGSALIEFLDQVRAREAAMPALVLLDINMPGIDGFEALERIRSMPEFERVPVIAMLTNSNDPKDVEKSVALGADSFFTKPSDIQDYVEFFGALAP